MGETRARPSCHVGALQAVNSIRMYAQGPGEEAGISVSGLLGAATVPTKGSRRQGSRVAPISVHSARQSTSTEGNVGLSGSARAPHATTTAGSVEPRCATRRLPLCEQARAATRQGDRACQNVARRARLEAARRRGRPISDDHRPHARSIRHPARPLEPARTHCRCFCLPARTSESNPRWAAQPSEC